MKCTTIIGTIIGTTLVLGVGAAGIQATIVGAQKYLDHDRLSQSLSDVADGLETRVSGPNSVGASIEQLIRQLNAIEKDPNLAVKYAPVIENARDSIGNAPLASQNKQYTIQELRRVASDYGIAARRESFSNVFMVIGLVAYTLTVAYTAFLVAPSFMRGKRRDEITELAQELQRQQPGGKSS